MSRAGRPPKKALPVAAKLNFLLGASDKDLDSFQLARLAEVANLRSDLHAILDKLIDEMAQAAVAGWFRQTNREALKRAVESAENPQERIDEVVSWAKKQIRDGQRSESELVPLVPRISVAVSGSARSMAYQERQIAKGLCSVCPKPLARNSVRYCERHLEIVRLRKPPKGAKGSLPGSVDWLYGDGVFESAHNKAPSQVKALKEANEKRKKQRDA
jgi:hypothetical protein